MAVLTKEKLDAMRKAMRAKKEKATPASDRPQLSSLERIRKRRDPLVDGSISSLESEGDGIVTTPHESGSPRKRSPLKSRYLSEDILVSPAIIRKAFSGELDATSQPKNIAELIGMLEDSTFSSRNSVSVVKALQRLPKSFEREMLENQENVIPGTYLDIETDAGMVRYCFGSEPFNDCGRMMFTMYIIQPTGDTRIAIAYLSGSQAAWRLLPDIDGFGWIDKGELGEHAYTLPYEVQMVLDRMAAKFDLDSLNYIPADHLITCPPDDFDEKKLEEHRKNVEEITRSIPMRQSRPKRVPNKPIPPEPKFDPAKEFIENVDFEGIKKFFRELPDDLWPEFDLSRVSLTKTRSTVYGTFFRAALLSKDSGIRYVFNITSEGVFLASIEDPISNINKYGVHEKAVVVSFPQDILIPKAEYGQQFKNGMRKGRRIDYGYFVVDKLHQELPLLLEANRFFALWVCELKKINRQST